MATKLKCLPILSFSFNMSYLTLVIIYPEIISHTFLKSVTAILVKHHHYQASPLSSS